MSLFDFKLGPLEGIVIRMQDSEYELHQAGSKNIEIQRQIQRQIKEQTTDL